MATVQKVKLDDAGKALKQATDFQVKALKKSAVRTLILATCIDSGFVTLQVYDYCKARERWNVFAIKGAKEETGFKRDFGVVSRMASNNKDSGHSWYMVSGLTGKEEPAFKLDAGQVLGGVFFPHAAIRAGGGRFFSGLVAERPVGIGRGGIKWVRKGSLTGEPLDCYVYSAAARELARRIFPRFHAC
jgi:phage terminase large subunit GpA-like protein